MSRNMLAFTTLVTLLILINTYNVGIIGSQNIEAQPMESVQLAIHVIGHSFIPKYKIHALYSYCTNTGFFRVRTINYQLNTMETHGFQEIYQENQEIKDNQ